MYAALVIPLFFGVASAFLYHQQNVKTFIESDAKYYGYTVLLQKGYQSKLVVGSPLDETTGSVFINNIQSGSKEKFKPTIHDDRLPTNWLFGAGMDGGETVGESVMVCQPRYTISRRISNEENYFANGDCYVFPNINETVSHQEIFPNAIPSEQVMSQKYYRAFGQAGMSVMYLDNYKEFIVGSPGLLNWAGGAIKISEQDLALPPQTRGIKYDQRYRMKLRRSEKTYVEYTYELLVQLKNKKLRELDYGGYSVAYGELSKGSKYFIVGAPRSDDLQGSVVYIDSTENDAAGTLYGPDILGSYFGSSLCVLDINGDGLDDLLVGAPMERYRTFDEGAVYQYINGPKVSLTLHGKITQGQVGGRFGTAMSNLGKITLDNFDSVGISSPYENKGKGAVYIYIGTKEGLKFSQRIEAAPNAVGFGFALSRGVDVDNNDANDLAVGAYQSSSTHLYFARPVFYYEIAIKSNARLYSYQENKPFNINYCVRTKKAPTVLTNITVQYDGRLKNIQTSDKVDVNGEYCNEVVATLYDNLNDIDTPVTIVVSVQEEECPKCPVSSPSFGKIVQHRIPFLYNCGEDQICTPDFTVSSDIGSIYTVGSNEDFALTVNIENRGEFAYICKLQLDLPTDVTVKSASKECNNNNCILTNPLTKTEFKTFNLDFSKLAYVARTVEFTVYIDCLNYSTSATSTVNLRYKSVLYVEGGEEVIIYKNKNTTADVRTKFAYFIKNEGPSFLEKHTFIIRVPTNLGSAKILDVYEPTINSQVDVSCTPSMNYTEKENVSKSKNNVKASQAFDFKSEDISCKDGKIECMIITCTARKFFKGLTIKISIPIAPNIDPIVKEYTTSFNIISEMTYEMESQTHRIESKIKLSDNDEGTYITYWPIILGIILGLLILGGIVFAAYKMGFFKRTKYDKMQQEKLKDKEEELFELKPNEQTADE